MITSSVEILWQTSISRLYAVSCCPWSCHMHSCWTAIWRHITMYMINRRKNGWHRLVRERLAQVSLSCYSSEYLLTVCAGMHLSELQSDSIGFV